jgi:hypothetical protein
MVEVYATANYFFLWSKEFCLVYKLPCRCCNSF